MELRWNWLSVLIASVVFSLHLVASGNIEDIQSITFEKAKIKINNIIISVELAKTHLQQERGLMFRTKLPKNAGMLFIFDDERTLSFWMKNTLIDLSIAYINKDKQIVDIQEMKSTSVLDRNIPSYPSKKAAKYALEMSSGWFTQNKIKVGDSFEFIKSTRR